MAVSATKKTANIAFLDRVLARNRALKKFYSRFLWGGLFLALLFIFGTLLLLLLSLDISFFLKFLPTLAGMLFGSITLYSFKQIIFLDNNLLFLQEMLRRCKSSPNGQPEIILENVPKL